MNYVLGKEQAALLHAEGVLAESNRDIIRSFILQAGMNPDLKKPVGHIALSYSPVDAPKLTDGKMVQLAQEYMREMKITDTQYIIVRHQDREHPHVHIVFNRIDNNGKTISDRNDMYRNEQVCKKLKAKHGLYFAKGKEHVKQHRLREPDKSKYEISACLVGSEMCIRDSAYLFVTIHVVPVRNGLAVIVYAVEHDMHMWVFPVLMAHDDILRIGDFHFTHIPVSYTHLTLPTN